MITFDQISQNREIRTYIKRGNELLGTLGYTEHSFIHAGRVASCAANILSILHYNARTVELARIAGFMHDIGNVINRYDHAQSGAILSFQILTRLGMEAEEIATVIGAIGNHDEGTGGNVNPVAAALILADKSDVRRSRVRNTNTSAFDIHDRVNFAVKDPTVLSCDPQKNSISLEMHIDTSICSIMDYFEIFLQRMMMCRRAADYFDLKFELIINNARML